jgi:polysaccharide biosynthesis transport protein
VVDERTTQSKVVDAYLDRLSVDPVRNSRLVALSFVSRDPHLAVRVANAAADTFISHQLDQKVHATRYATNFLAQQLDTARDRLEDAEKRLNHFLAANNIIFLNTEKTGQPPDLVTQQLAVLSDALLKARGERIAKESLVRGLKESDMNSVPAVLRSQLISQLKQEAATLDSEYKRLGQIFKPEYPRMQQLAEKIRETRRQLEVEVDRAVGAVRAEYEAAVQNERDLEAALVQQQSRARGLSARMAEYNLLRRNVDTGRELHGSLLSRLRETQISASLLTSNIYVADRAELPTAPWRPRKMWNLLLGLVIGLFGGVGLAFVIDYLDTTI